MMQEATIADATLIAVPPSTKNKEIDSVTSTSKLYDLIEPYYPTVGGARRPPIGLARTCLAIRGFVSIDLNRELAPDATTRLKFRRLLVNNELTRKIVDSIHGHLAAEGPTTGMSVRKHTSASTRHPVLCTP